MGRRIVATILSALIFVAFVLGFVGTGHCDTRLVVRPKIVNWFFEPFTVYLYVLEPEDDWTAYCVGWGDGEKSCRDLPDEVGMHHIYKVCQPEMTITVIFGKEKDGKLKITRRMETTIRVTGCE
jgi:hypothetical protein